MINVGYRMQEAFNVAVIGFVAVLLAGGVCGAIIRGALRKIYRSGSSNG